MALDAKNYPGLLQKGNLDLSNRPNVKNPEAGGRSSVWSITIGEEQNGKEVTVLIPRIREDGKIMSVADAIKHYEKNGKHMGKFNTREEADRYSKDYSNSVGNKKTDSVLDILGKQKPKR
jgi:hypothetical protein